MNPQASTRKIIGALLAAASCLVAGSASATCTTGQCVYRIYAPGIKPTYQTVLTTNPGTLAFGSVATGQSLSKTFTLTNTGNTATSSLAFSLPTGVTQTNTCGTAIASGSSCTVTAKYSPTAVSTLSGSITVTDQDNFATVQVSGAGIASNIAIIDASYYNGAYSCNPASVLTADCAGKTSCSVTMSNSLCGDPHPNYVKSWYIDYSCNGVAKPQLTGSENATATLSCP